MFNSLTILIKTRKNKWNCKMKWNERTIKWKAVPNHFKIGFVICMPLPMNVRKTKRMDIRWWEREGIGNEPHGKETRESNATTKEMCHYEGDVYTPWGKETRESNATTKMYTNHGERMSRQVSLNFLSSKSKYFHPNDQS